MKPWNKRPFEYRRFYNPAFCAVLLMRAIKEYKNVSGKGMPFSLSFLILPLCLHEDSLNILNSIKKSSFLKVLSENPELLVGFADRVAYLLPYTLEGLGYAFQSESFIINKDGSLQIKNGGVKTDISGSIEVKACQGTAIYLGRAFARIGSTVTIFTSMGVRP